MKPVYIFICLALICSCNKSGTKDDQTKEFKNPIGYFKIENTNGNYSVIPDETIDPETFSRYFEEGGWKLELECVAQPHGVDTLGILVGGGVAYMAAQGEGVLRMFCVLDDTPERQHICYDVKYTYQGNIFKSDFNYVSCHIDGNSLILVRKENADTTWTCCKYVHVDESEIKEFEKTCTSRN